MNYRSLRKEEKEDVRIKIQKRRGGVFKFNGMSFLKLQLKKIQFKTTKENMKQCRKKY
jgi:hypothetical protein